MSKHRGKARVTVFCYHAKICLLDFRSIATREAVKWVNEFHSFPPGQNLRFLNADIRKVQNRGNAPTRVFKVRLICPAVVTKCEGPRSSRLQPAQLRAAPKSAAACGSRTRTRSENIQQEKRDGRAGPTSSPSIRSQASTFCTATTLNKFMNELSSECSI